jgi:hypothetical protein
VPDPCPLARRDGLAALSDHDRRDAEHVARMEVAILLQRYRRRLDEAAKLYVGEKLDEGARDGRAIDPVELGRAAAAHAIAPYFGIDSAPRAAIEASADPADGFA